MIKVIPAFLLFFLYTSASLAQETGALCLNEEEKENIIKAVEELDNIHSSPATVEVEPIIIIRDWENRVYVNGQGKKPLKMKINIGDHVSRELQVELPVQVSYREEPEPPMFRLRVRAQFGLLSTPIVDMLSGDSKFNDALDGGIGWDFFQISQVNMNLSAYTGVRSAGGGLGLDLTKNFGVYAGYSFIYETFKGSALGQVYFSFN